MSKPAFPVATQDDALIFEMNQTPDGYDDSPDSEDPTGGHHNLPSHAPKGRFDYPRNAERHCQPVPSGPRFVDPDVDPQRLDARQLTAPTRARDRELLSDPRLKRTR